MKTLITLILLTASLPAFAESTFDRRLTKAEMAKVLPQYVALVERSAAELPSANDNQALGMAAHGVTNPIYGLFKNGEFIGLQSHKIASLIEQLESVVAELRAVSPADRQADAASLVAGFKGADDAGKITCRLGYYYSSKIPTERIVKCEDNRSQSGYGDDDEGYYDVRRIILSIDAKTLEPLAVIKLAHDIAG